MVLSVARVLWKASFASLILVIIVAIFPPTAFAAVSAAVDSSARSGTVGIAMEDLAPVRTPSSYIGSWQCRLLAKPCFHLKHVSAYSFPFGINISRGVSVP